MNTLLLETLFALGLVGGFFSGLLGIGGGIIMVPLLLYIPPLLGFASLSMKLVAGITMVQSLAGSLSGLIIQRYNNFVHSKLVLYMGTSSLAGGLIGSVWSKTFLETAMLATFAGLALLASVLLFLPSKNDNDKSDLTDVRFNKMPAILIGSVVGLLGGIIGQGGAFLLIPLMLYILSIPTRIALGSSVAIAFLSALAGFIGKWSTNQVPFLMAFIVALGAVLGAQVGGIVGKRVQTGTLRAVLAVLIAGTALRMSFSLFSGFPTNTALWVSEGVFVIVCLVIIISRIRSKIRMAKLQQNNSVVT